MSYLDKHKEVCELLKVWFYIRSQGMTWPDALSALEDRINILLTPTK